MAETPTSSSLVGEVPVKGGDVIRVVRHRWGKYDCLDLRRWVPAQAGDPHGHIPTAKGIRLQLAHWQRLLPLLSGAVSGGAARD